MDSFCKEFLKLDFLTKTKAEVQKSQATLANQFYKNKSVEDSIEITKSILESLKYNTPNPTIFLKGISRHIKDPLSPLYEHAVILTAAVFKDENFKLTEFSQYELFKSLMPEECHKKKEVKKLRSKFDTEIEVINDLSIFTFSKPICYIQEAIKIIKEENKLRLEEAFNLLPILINKSSNRIIQARFIEYYNTILNYDGFDIVKHKALSALFSRHNIMIRSHVVPKIFSKDTCLKFKVCLTNALIKLINETENTEVISDILSSIVEQIDTRKKDLHKIVTCNLKHIIEICAYKLK